MTDPHTPQTGAPETRAAATRAAEPHTPRAHVSGPHARGAEQHEHGHHREHHHGHPHEHHRGHHHGPDGEFIDRLADRLAATSNARTVFGDPVERDGITVVPVARARFGFGGGSGRKEGEQGYGGGGGLMVAPIGYIELKSGNARFRPVLDPSAFVPAIVAGGVLAILILRTIFRR